MGVEHAQYPVDPITATFFPGVHTGKSLYPAPLVYFPSGVGENHYNQSNNHVTNMNQWRQSSVPHPFMAWGVGERVSIGNTLREVWIAHVSGERREESIVSHEVVYSGESGGDGSR